MKTQKALPSTMSADEFQALIQSREPESSLQQRCVKWFRTVYPNLLLFAIPNGGNRTKAEAGILIGEGVTQGIPDTLLAYPRNGKSGLFIELKTTSRNSRPSEAQIKIQTHLRAVGYEVAMPTTYEEFQRIIINYLQD